MAIKFNFKSMPLVSVALLVLLLPMMAFIANLGVIGPMIQPDEGSYLANAAAIVGYVNDFASSYSAGYSLLISPAFIFGGDPLKIWFYVKAINAFIYCLMGAGLWCLASTRYAGNGKFFERVFAVLVVLCYPMWPIMVGYSFAQLSFACVFVWAVLFLQRFSDTGKYSDCCLFALFSGFLYWIHPTGLVAVLAGGISFVFLSIKIKNLFWLFLYSSCSIGMVFLYKIGFQAWLIDRMTIGGMPNFHYPSLGAILTPLFSIDGLREVFGRLAGHLFYLVVGTLGLFWIGCRASFVSSASALNFVARGWHEATRGAVHIFVVLCVVGVLLVSVLLFSSTEGADRLDHWMYGRYVEGVIAPLLLLGSIYFTRSGVLQSVVVGALAGVLFFLIVDDYGHTAPFNVSTFWQDFYIRDKGPLWWISCGVILTVIVAALGRVAGRLLIVLFFGFCTYLQIDWHERRSVAASGRWELASSVRADFDSGACVGFDHSGIDSGSKHAYWFDFGFQLYDYNLQRMSPKKWFDGGCDGPLFSYSNDLDQRFEIDAHLAARGVIGGPFMWKKGGFKEDVYPMRVEDKPASLPPVLAEGWHGLERRHVWSGAEARLRLPVTQRCKVSQCVVKIDFSVFGASEDRPVKVLFSSRGYSNFELSRFYSSAGPFSLDFKLSQDSNYSDLYIQVPDAISPRELIGSQDARVLGVALHSVYLEDGE